MRKQALIFVALMIGLSLPAWAATVRVKANGTPLRAKALADSEVVLRLDQGAVLELVDVERDWYQVRDPRSRKEGFVLSSLVELLPGDSSQAAGVGRLATSQKRPPPKPAARPLPGQWRDKGFLTVSGAFQGQGNAFGYSFSPAEYAYAEQAHINANYPTAAGPAFDAGAGVRVWHNLALGAALSFFSRSSAVSVDGTVPHPLYVNRDRTVSGTFDGDRSETGAHVQATWVVPAGRRTFVSVAGGPSFIEIKQSIATGINLSTVYPYDTTTLTSTRTSTVSKLAIGVNAGVDVAYFFTRSVGVGGLVRYAWAPATLQTPGGSVDTTAGGVQAGVGLRVRLAPGPTPAKPPAKGPARAPAPPPPPVKK